MAWLSNAMVGYNTLRYLMTPYYRVLLHYVWYYIIG